MAAAVIGFPSMRDRQTDHEMDVDEDVGQGDVSYSESNRSHYVPDQGWSALE